MRIFAIGWDVRGWRGNQQAVAVLKTGYSSEPPSWSISNDFQFPTNEPLNLSSLLIPALGEQYQAEVSTAEQIVIAIDAPLAFPVPFVQLLTNSDSVFSPTPSEVENPLAYRECEKWIYQAHRKKPLSAPFDKLGNGATLAISLTHALKHEGFDLIPQDCSQSQKAIIEVYPGIAKTGPKKNSPAIKPIHQLIRDDLQPGSDRYDAAICAITAAVFAGAGEQLGLPDLIGPQSGFDDREGWIYSYPADYISANI